MKRFSLLTLLAVFSALMAFAQSSWTADNGNGTYTNPLFYDEFSDPDIIRVGDDYYLAGTTMHAVPGLVILHSKDLVNWENVAYCFDRFDFPEDKFSLKNKQEVYGQGIWAPCIRYANGQFYVFSNVNGKGLQCWTSKDIKGPWKHHNLKGKIYDLGVLFDDDGKMYAFHGYGEVHCTQLKDDLSGPVEGSDSIVIKNGSGVGEGHHAYKINGMYYLISTDYRPNGRTICSRAKNIYGPYEQCTITADETFGYHPVGLTQWKGRIADKGHAYSISKANENEVAAGNIHQGGIVETQNGEWYALLMMDFHSVGRTTTLAPVTWKDGWPYVGLEGNLGRAPRTWTKPNIPGAANIKPHAPYERNENFNGKTLGRVWQWNHNPDDSKWSLTGGRLRLNTLPADQFMWARNTLTQRAIGPRSICTVELYTKNMKDGDVAGLADLNIPYSALGLTKIKNSLYMSCYEQLKDDSVTIHLIDSKGTLKHGFSGDKIYLRIDGDYDKNIIQYYFSFDGKKYYKIGRKMPLSYQLCTFQGSRVSLFAYNFCGRNGGFAEFDNFTCVETQADRSKNIPLEQKIHIINVATGKPMHAMSHGLLHDNSSLRSAPAEGTSNNKKMSRADAKKMYDAEQVFTLVDKGNGKVLLKCEDGRYVFVTGIGMPGDVKLTKDESKAEEFMYQDYLGREFMLMSTRTHKYLGKSPKSGSPYSMDYTGADPARKNGAVFKYKFVAEDEKEEKDDDDAEEFKED